MKRKNNYPRGKNKSGVEKKTTSIEKIRAIMELLNLNNTSEKEKIDDIKEKEKINLNDADDNMENIEVTSSLKIQKEINNSSNNKIISSQDNIKMSTLKEKEKKGLPDKNYFYTKFKNWENYDNNEFHFTNVDGDGNCGYRCVSLQLFGSEDDYNIIRQNVFHYLDKNRSNYSDYNFEYNGNILSNNQYIDTIQHDGEWMGELEIIAISIIYNINILVFKITDND